MLKRLMLTTAIGAALLTPVLAQDSGTGTTETPPPAPLAQEQATPGAPADVAAEQPVEPPPADAIIAAEGTTDMRADKLIGAAVYNTAGEEVGAVEDIVFDRDGRIVGVVLKVGGLLGLGGKAVGIKWDEVKMLPESRLLQIGYSEEQLKVAPDFKTREALAAEQELEQSRQPPAQPTQ